MMFFFLFLLVFLSPGFGYGATIINGDVQYGIKYIDSSLVIGNNITYAPDSLFVTETILLENNGVLETDVYVCDICDLFVKNRGVINSDFYLGDASRLFQVVTDENDMIYADFGVEYSVLLDGANNLSLDSVLDFVDDAGLLVLKNSVLDINGVAPGLDRPIEIAGDISLRISELDNLYERVFFENVSGNGVVYLITDRPDVLFSDVAYVTDGKLVFSRVRETDYVKIFNNDLGFYLNSLRIQNPNDTLLVRLDDATSMNQLHDIMSRTVRLNPDVLLDLMRGVDVMTRVAKLNPGYGMLIEPMFILSDDFNVRGLGVGYSDSIINKLDLAFFIRVGDIRYESDFDDFAGLFYGLDLMANYSFDNNVFIRGEVGLAHYVFDIGSAFYQGNIVSSPAGITAGLGMDTGYEFNISDSFSVSPFVGLEYLYNEVEMESFGVFRSRVGARLGYAYEVMGIGYNYDVFVNVNSELDCEFMGRVAFWSDLDALGGDISFGIGDVDANKMYKISIGARAQF